MTSKPSPLKRDPEASELRRTVDQFRDRRRRKRRVNDVLELVAIRERGELVRQARTMLWSAGLARHAEDVVQDAFTKVLSSGTFSPDFTVEQIVNYVRKTVRTRCIDLMREKQPIVGYDPLDEPVERRREFFTVAMSDAESSVVAADFIRDVLDRAGLTLRERELFERIISDPNQVLTMREIAAERSANGSSEDIARLAANLRSAKWHAGRQLVRAIGLTALEATVYGHVHRGRLSDEQAAADMGISVDEFQRLHFSALNKVMQYVYADGEGDRNER